MQVLSRGQISKISETIEKHELDSQPEVREFMSLAMGNLADKKKLGPVSFNCYWNPGFHVTLLKFKF